MWLPMNPAPPVTTARGMNQTRPEAWTVLTL
jgi:hypothetical protein